MLDALRAVRASGQPRFTGFLSERERQLATAQLNREGWAAFAFCGGYEGAEREMLCVFEDNEEIAFPLAALRITRLETQKELTHRDYLGALLALGIDRACLGDILPDDEGAVAVVQAAMAGHIAEQLAAVGRCPVRAELLEAVPRDAARQEGTPGSASVASLRLDAVLAAMLHLSREKAAALVLAERVQVNHRSVAQLHHLLEEGDLLSVRGAGRLRLDAVNGQSKKGRYRIAYTVF